MFAGVGLLFKYAQNRMIFNSLMHEKKSGRTLKREGWIIEEYI